MRGQETTGFVVIMLQSEHWCEIKPTKDLNCDLTCLQ